MSETVIITGGAGFIGSHVAQLLLDRGHEVHAVDNLSTGKKANLPRKVELHEVDIRAKTLPGLFKKIAPTRVIHLAAHIDVRGSMSAPKDDADINIMGSLNVIEATLLAGAKHLTFASTAAVYGNAGHYPVPEDAAKQPSSPYGIAKLAVEHYLHVAHHFGGLHSAVLRFANVYGPRQNFKGEAGAVAIFFNKVMRGEKVVIYGDGEQTRDFVYAGDVAACAAMVMEKNIHGIFNVSTGRETSVKTLYEKIRTIAGSSEEAEQGPMQPNEDRRSSLDPRKAAGVIGWRAEVSLDVGLRKTFEAFKK